MKKDSKPVTVGERLIELRGIRTRTGTAKALNISYSSLCNYEHDRRVPPDKIKVRISKFYGVPVGEIFFANDNYES